MTFIDRPRDPVRIWFEVTGSGEPVTTIGGDLLASRQFHFVQPALEREFTLVSWDFRGAGRSDRPIQEYTIDTKVDDLLAVLDAAGIERTHVWATATGSYTAIRLAARHPERVAAVITYGQYRPEPAMWAIWNSLDTIFSQFDWPDSARFVCKLFGGPASHEEWLGEEFEKGSTAEIYRLMHPPQISADLTEELRATRCPLLVMLGDSGRMGAGSGYAKGIDGMRELRPDLELAVIPGATGTYCMISHPEESARAAIDFLKRNPLA
jgi:3-oxoadipate enol-lactonase